MMKWLLWILLLVNLLLFSFMQWGEALLGKGNTPPNQTPLHAEKIRLLASSSDSLAPLAASSVAVVSQVQPSSVVACLEWGEFSGADLARADAALATLSLGNKLGQRQVEYTSGYWAYIPPSKMRADTDRKVAILKDRGVEHFIVQEAGKWHNAISLGVFKTTEAAHKFLETLRAKRIKTALVGERLSKLKFTVFVLTGLDPVANSKIKALQNEFPGSEMKDAPCNSLSSQSGG